MTTRTTLITGASGTLGGAIARALMTRGYALGLQYCTHEDSCEALAAEARAKGLHATWYAADFADVAAPAALATAFLKDHQRIDALVWASGIVRDAPLLTQSEDDLRATLNVDLKAFFLTLKALSRQFIKQKSGAVVALSSHAALAGRAGGSAYAMAHSGLLALVKSAAREWGPLGVRVNAVLPPFVPESGMGRGASAEFLAAAQGRRVLKADVDGAAAVAGFVADVLANPAISGQVLSVDSRITV
jgi:3-oxoacyl-[acyl-carrier protein] reductase